MAAPKKARPKKGSAQPNQETWVYEALTPLGATITGDIRAVSENDACQSLRQRGFFVTKIKRSIEDKFDKEMIKTRKLFDMPQSHKKTKTPSVEEILRAAKGLPPIKIEESYTADGDLIGDSADAKTLNTLQKLSNTDILSDEVRSKIMVDLFAAPLTLIPFVMGCTAIIASWIFGSVPILAAGLMGTVVGVGVFLTKFIFGMDKLSKNAHEQVLKNKETENNKVLDALDEALRKDRDPRPEECLRQLRALREVIVERAKGNALGIKILDNFNNLFEVSIKQIEQTYDLWRLACEAKGDDRKSILERREKIVLKIVESTSQLVKTVEQLKAGESDVAEIELSDAQKEFSQTMEAAKRTTERLANLHNKNYDPKEFE